MCTMHKKKQRTYLQLVEHLENLLWWNNVRATIYTPHMHCRYPKLFKPSPIWRLFTSTTQVAKDTRITPLYFNKRFFGFIVLKINCDHFDSMVEEFKKDLIIAYCKFSYESKDKELVEYL